MAVTPAYTDADIRDCWPVMVQLRPHLKEADFVATVRRQFEEGYQLAFIRHDARVVCVAGFRIFHKLFSGRTCYVDDLATDEGVRSQGFGAELFAWLRDNSRREGCTLLELDSGVQRHAAHRFYLVQRMSIDSYHFSLKLGA
jgi:GNAT superfamily N-acetyltransferase